jgi:pilus assembly protein CpaC
MDLQAQPYAVHRNATQTRGTRMKRRLITTLLSAAACAVLPTALTFASVAQAQMVSSPKQQVVLSIGRGELVSVPGRMSDIFVANDEIADVQVKSQHQVYVFGKSAGETTVYASDASGNVIWSANVRVGSNIDSIDQMLNMAMPDAKVSVSTMGTNTVLLTGTIAAPEDAAEVDRLVQAFVGEKTNVISRLKMATPLQVNLQVKFAEVSRSLVRALGANLTSIDGTSGFQLGIGQGRTNFAPTFRPGSATGTGSAVKVMIPDPNKPGQFMEVSGTSITPITPGSTLAMAGKFLGLDLAGALDLAERQGLVTNAVPAQPDRTVG